MTWNKTNTVVAVIVGIATLIALIGGSVWAGFTYSTKFVEKTEFKEKCAEFTVAFNSNADAIDAANLSNQIRWYHMTYKCYDLVTCHSKMPQPVFLDYQDAVTRLGNINARLGKRRRP